MNVEKRRYRFRLYNPGPSRWWEFALFDGTNFLPFWQISTDGNLLPNAVQVSSVRLSVAERVDIIVDFSQDQRIAALSGQPAGAGEWPRANRQHPHARHAVLQINLTGGMVSDDSVDPSGGGSGPSGIPLRPLPDPDFAALQKLAAKAKTRTWRFERGNGAWQVNGRFFDPDVVNARSHRNPKRSGSSRTPAATGGIPIHIHFEEHRVLSRDGVAIQAKHLGQRHDRLCAQRRGAANFNNEVRIFFRFRDMKGRYVMHCHNVVHEDHAMMIRWDIV